ncbi:hypothetical protein TNCT_607131 [Trichonephila clavata]|uniref:Uncharacterized protein n=1 Tax=Trichonephila clavata TaxID=2740835 RepID=A0A8X6LLG5_TRICU|nr:hypothetical protein TNCT_607131 [Trichonephila clavata]
MKKVQVILIFVSVLKGARISFGSSRFSPIIPKFMDDTIITPEFLTDPPSVTIFLFPFQEAVLSSNVLSDLFDFSQISPVDFIEKMYPHILSMHMRYKVSNALQLTQSSVVPIVKYHLSLNMPLLVRVYAYTASKTAHAEGILDEENAVAMAFTFADIMRESAKRYMKSGNADWKYKALSHGFEDFMIKFGLFSKENIPLIVQGQIGTFSSSRLFSMFPKLEDSITVPESHTVPPSVAIFMSTFHQEVHFSKFLSELLNFSGMTAQEFGRKVKPYIMYTHTKYKVANALQSIRSCVEPILNYRRPLSLAMIVRTYGYSVSKFAYYEGVLDKENAVSLALTFADLLQGLGTRLKRSGDPDWKLNALSRGFIDFMNCFHLFSKESIPILATIYIKEWKSVS